VIETGEGRRPKEVIMAEYQFMLTAEEHECLRSLLEAVQKNTLIEEHRTRTRTNHERVKHQEDLVKGLLSKLQQPPG
jgi:hypothetical protein